MKTATFLRIIQNHTARVAITASATRKQGKGVRQTAYEFMAELPLRPFGTGNPHLFAARLNSVTLRLLSRLPRRCRKRWGLARKLINIFLRDALYTTYLAKAYRLHRAAAFYEVPLDSIVAKKLRALCRDDHLNRWKSLRSLERSASRQYQRAAATLATKHGINRVDLDAWLWADRDNAIAISAIPFTTPR